MKQRLGALLGAAPLAPAEAIAVLGCRVGADGAPGRALAERLEAGLALYRAGLAPTVLVTGGRAWRGVVEADVMAEHLARQGVPRGQLLVERASRTTRENGRLGGRLLLDRGVRTLLVVTQPLHLRRACRAFAATGLEPRGVLIRASYQLRPAMAPTTAKDLAREVAAGLADLVASSRGR